MRTIVVESARYPEGVERILTLVYRGTSWKIFPEIKDYPVLEIYNDTELISTHKSWDNVKFADELVSETMI